MERGPAGADLSVLARDYFALALPCPLLAEERCGLHDVRPLSCRDFNVTTPAEWCAEPTSHPVHKIATPPLLAVPLARLTAKLTRAKTALIPLGLAMQWVDSHAALGFAKWPGDRLLRALVREIRQSG
jgi:Fe-S-cluster containining protein